MASSTIKRQSAAIETYTVNVDENVVLRFTKSGRIVSVQYSADGKAITTEVHGSVPNAVMPSTRIGFAINGTQNNYCVISPNGYRVRCDDAYGNGSTAYII